MIAGSKCGVYRKELTETGWIKKSGEFANFSEKPVSWYYYTYTFLSRVRKKFLTYIVEMKKKFFTIPTHPSSKSYCVATYLKVNVSLGYHQYFKQQAKSEYLIRAKDL